MKRTTAIRALRAWSSGRIQNPNLLLLRQELKRLLRKNSVLTPHDLELPGLPLDRLFLHKSKSYLRTRERAWSLGIRFEASTISKDRAFSNFSAESRVLAYSPIEAELNWICSLPYTHEAERALISILKFVTPLYHDTNHALIFTTLRPKSLRGRWKTVRNYFALVESMAILRDAVLAQDLGAISQPLTRLGFTYRDNLSSSLAKTESATDFTHQAESIFLQFQVPKKSKGQSGFRVDPSFLDNTFGDWTSEYRKKFGSRLVLGPSVGACRIDIDRPFNDNLTLWCWYQSLFLGIYSGVDDRAQKTLNRFVSRGSRSLGFPDDLWDPLLTKESGTSPPDLD